MAELKASLPSISPGTQFKAIAFLRWRLFVNGFRRKGGAGELVARIFVIPVAFLFIVGPSLGAAFAAWAAVHSHKLDLLAAVFLGVTLLQIFVSINLSPPGLSFDPEALIRFPITFSRYLTVRLFLGLLSASTVIGTCALLSAAIGVTVAQPALAWIAFPAAILLSITNMLFIRMIFAWIDRWLSTRRAREIFTGLLILFSVAVQWVNVTFNPGFSHHDLAAQKRKLAAALHFYNSSQMILSHFPGGLAGASILNYGNGSHLHALANLIAIVLFAALFLAVFASRMQLEYRGEVISESASTDRTKAVIPALESRPTPHAAAIPAIAAEPGSALLAAFQKEWIYLRRNSAQLFGMLTPLAMVFLFAGRIGNQFTKAGWTYPAAVAYSVLGVAILAYNCFGLDGAGIQFYFLAPVPLRTIVLAKNIFNFGIAALEAIIIYAVLSFIATRPDLLVTIATLCWLIFASLVNITVGNMRSITAPKKMEPGKFSRKQASQFSALISIGILLAIAALGVGTVFLGSYTGRPWLPVPILFTLAAIALVLYLQGLDRLDDLAYRNRENMIEELCKAS